MSKNEGVAVVKNEKAQLAERFTGKVLACYGEISAKAEFTSSEKELIAGYFVKIDESLKDQSISWRELEENGKMNEIAISLSNKAMLGLDMRIDNHFFVIPSRSKKNGKITIKYITGYKGEKHIAMQFAITKPLDIIAELVYSTDEFEPIKSPDGDSYVLKITNAFSRGEIIGGFAYIKNDDERLNRIFELSIQKILERKPTYVWDNDNFWAKHPEAMYKKTLIKEACKNIDIDVNKIKEFRNVLDFEAAEQLEQEKVDAQEVAKEETGTGDIVDVEYSEIVE